MMDDIDREVCMSLKGAIMFRRPEWEIEREEFLDPGYILYMVIHKGTSMEAHAKITLDFISAKR